MMALSKAHLLKTAWRHRPKGPGGPLAFGLLITYRCNLHCAYCRLPEIADREMDASQIYRIAKEFRDLGSLRMGISGGEPLLRPDLGEIIDVCSRLGLMINLNTNGWLLAERINQLRGASLITVSLNGPKNIHDLLVGGGAFERTIAGVKAAAKFGKKTAAIMVITSSNVGFVRQTMKIAASLGLTMYLQPVTPCDVSGDMRDELLPDRDLLVSEIEWVLHNKSLLPLGTSKAFLRHLLLYPDFKNSITCRAGEKFCYVTPEGELTACHVHFRGDNPSALEQGVRKALILLKRPDCEGCAISPYMESNLIFNWNFESIWNAFKTIQ